MTRRYSSLDVHADLNPLYSDDAKSDQEINSRLVRGHCFRTSRVGRTMALHHHLSRAYVEWANLAYSPPFFAFFTGLIASDYADIAIVPQFAAHLLSLRY